MKKIKRDVYLKGLTFEDAKDLLVAWYMPNMQEHFGSI